MSFVEIDGGIRAYFAEPEAANEMTPTVVMAMHLWGVDSSQRAAADRFASEGFATLVPDLYEGLGAPDGDGATDASRFYPLAKSLSFETVDPMILSAARWLKQRFPQTSTCIAGFCMGGVMALRRAHGYRDTFAAAAVWYGSLAGVEGAQIDVPLVASYGAEDKGIPVESVEQFTDALKVPHDVKIYGGAQHAFCDEERAAYHAQAAEDSWSRTMAFLKRVM